MFCINFWVGELFTTSANNKLDGICRAGADPAQKGHININKSDTDCVARLSAISLSVIYEPVPEPEMIHFAPRKPCSATEVPLYGFPGPPAHPARGSPLAGTLLIHSSNLPIKILLSHFGQPRARVSPTELRRVPNGKGP